MEPLLVCKYLCMKQHSLIADVVMCSFVTGTILLLSPPPPLNCRHTSSAHTDFVHGLSWHPSEHQLVTCAWDGQVLQHTVTVSDQKGILS